jgi:hypothetical protein
MAKPRILAKALTLGVFCLMIGISSAYATTYDWSYSGATTGSGILTTGAADVGYNGSGFDSTSRTGWTRGRNSTEIALRFHRSGITIL